MFLLDANEIYFEVWVRHPSDLISVSYVSECWVSNRPLAQCVQTHTHTPLIFS